MGKARAQSAQGLEKGRLNQSEVKWEGHPD